ncbi:hypothetical protein DICVIV_06837 [Dictyocaulus viviparus]|uniref:SPARC/Testican calcium-binding domain-containing protein n=1 Tax=Dictyocaulus viviparus TaxID=29172 RepID=A0A0D8XTC8_DICVI|nr:hypothetical protein DICVIV_06837 [Dictyocaulus viviparus]
MSHIVNVLINVQNLTVIQWIRFVLTTTRHSLHYVIFIVNVVYVKKDQSFAKKNHMLSECTDDLMAQFPERMADWLFQLTKVGVVYLNVEIRHAFFFLKICGKVMRELKKRRELQKLEWEELIQEAEVDDEKRHVYPVIWKFCDLDIKPHDKAVSHHELIPITAPVIPMESCIKPFLEGCDTDNDGTISIIEWGKCLGLKEGHGTVTNHFDDYYYPHKKTTLHLNLANKVKSRNVARSKPL